MKLVPTMWLSAAVLCGLALGIRPHVPAVPAAHTVQSSPARPFVWPSTLGAPIKANSLLGFYIGAIAPAQHLPTGGGYDYIEACRYDTDHRLMLGLPVDDPLYCVGATEPGETRAQRWIRTYNKEVGECRLPRGTIFCDPEIRRVQAVPPVLAWAELKP